MGIEVGDHEAFAAGDSEERQWSVRKNERSTARFGYSSASYAGAELNVVLLM